MKKLFILFVIIIIMAITHQAIKIKGDVGTADEWNDDHVISSGLQPRLTATFVVAANDSENKEQADYVCDGSGDQAEINTALDDLPADGGRVILLEGNYSTSGSITFQKDNTLLVGQGRGTIVQRTPNGANVNLNSKNYVKIRNILFKGVGTGDWQNYGFYISGSNHVTIENCWIEGMIGNGFAITGGSSHIRILNNRISGCSIGARLHNTANSIIANNVIESNLQHGIVLVDGGHNNIIANNQIHNNDVNNTASFDGIFLDNVDNNVIVGNRCRDNDRYEINVSNAQCDKIVVVGNSLVGTDHVGAINDAGTGTIETGNAT